MTHGFHMQTHPTLFITTLFFTVVTIGKLNMKDMDIKVQIPDFLKMEENKYGSIVNRKKASLKTQVSNLHKLFTDKSETK